MTWGASWRRAVVVVVGVVVGALAGCSGGELLPEYTATDSATERLVPQPPPLEPVLPEQERSEHGAYDMAQYIFDLYAYMYATNDTKAFEALKTISGKDCKFCESVLTNVSQNAERSLRVDGASIYVKNVTPRDVDGFFFVVEVTYEQYERRVYDENRTVVATAEPTEDVVVIGLNWVDDAWEINGISDESFEATDGATP